MTIRRLFRTNKKKGLSMTNFSTENNTLFLKELIKAFDGKRNPIIVFTAKELARATNNYHPNLVIHRDGDYYDLYKAIYKETTHDWIVVAAKFHHAKDDWQNNLRKKRIINEVVVLSQINHKNIVKLLGCCLETELPILVYEHCHTNGTLSDYICTNNKPPLSWESRLRIATEIADAITYLHTFTSRPIIHRDITLDNIILDHQNVARLIGFSICIQIPIGQTHVEEEDVSKGTAFGYLDPQTMLTNRVSEKADVFGFGLVLFEILTGKPVYEFPDWEDDIDMQCNVKYLLEQNLLRQIVDPKIMRESGISSDDPQLKAYVNLAIECTNREEHKRPDMMQVAKELRRIWKTVQMQIGCGVSGS